MSLSAKAASDAPSCRIQRLAQMVGPVDQPVAVVAVEEKGAVVVEGGADGGVAVSGKENLVAAAEEQRLSQAPVAVRLLHSQPVYEAVAPGIGVPRVIAAAGCPAFSNGSPSLCDLTRQPGRLPLFRGRATVRSKSKSTCASSAAS